MEKRLLSEPKQAFLARALSPYAPENFVEVPIGEIRYSSDKPLVSHRFANCVGVVLDFGNSALMTHVLPTSKPGIFDSHACTCDNFTDKLAEEAQRKNLNLKNVEALVSFGLESPREEILSGLQRIGVRVRSIEDSYANSNPLDRSVFYDVGTKQLVVTDSRPYKFKQ